VGAASHHGTAIERGGHHAAQGFLRCSIEMLAVAGDAVAARKPRANPDV
jgi:hypothetical protein